MIGPLLRLFRRATIRADQVQYTRATIGRANVDGTWTIETEDNPDLWYVTIENSVVDRVEPRNAPRLRGMPVFVEIDPITTRRYISRPDPQKARQFVGDNVPISPVGVHTHEPGLGNVDLINPLRFRPGLLSLNGDMTVYIQEQYIGFNGQRYYIAAGNFDLTPYIPIAGSDTTWAWVLIGVDTSAQVYTAVTGDAIGVFDGELTPQLLAAIDFGLNIPLAGVKVRSDQTALTDWRLVRDARLWTSGGTGAANGYQIDRISTRIVIPANAQGNYREEVVIEDGGELVVNGRLYIGNG